MSLISFSQDETKYIAPSWQNLEELAFALSQQIKQDQPQVDRIVTLAKGGWPMTRSLVDFLQVTKIASIGVKFYQGINQRLAQPKIYQDLPVSIRGETVLLFDDVADTGQSLIFTQNYLQTKGVKNIITATLYYKPHSQLKPNYIGQETEAWIIFPYDTAEMIRVLGQKWREQEVSEDKIKQRFKQLRFPAKQIAYYSQS